MLPPIEDEQKAEEHTAQVGEVCHAIGTEQSLHQLDGGIANHKPLGLDGHEKVEIDALVGKCHAKGKQDAIHRTRRTHGDAPARDEKVAQSCPYTANQIIEQKASRAPEIFQHVIKHPEGEHIEEDMFDAGMHKHVGEQLPDAETACGYGIEGTHRGDVCIPIAF